MVCEKEALEIRKRLEGEGYVLTQQEYELILEHTKRKLELTGHEMEYLPYLLEDEIKNYFFRCAINAATFLMMADDIKNKGGHNGTSNDRAIPGGYSAEPHGIAYEKKGCAAARI